MGLRTYHAKLGAVARMPWKRPLEDQERAERLVETAKKYCLIANSLKTPVKVELMRKAGAAAP